MSENCNPILNGYNIKYFFTQSGLYKYNGNTITVYKTSNSDLPSDSIKRGCMDANGRLWLGTPQGLASLENYTITRYDKTNSELDNEQITALALGADNRLWIGTPNGLVVKDGNTWTRLTPENSGLPAPYIFGLAIDNNGSVWMGTGNKVSKNFNRLPSFNDCPESMVGLVKYDGTKWIQFNSTNSPLSSNYVNGLTIDTKGNIWIGTASNTFKAGEMISGCGLLKFNGSTWTAFNSSNSLIPDNDVQWVGADRLGNIWFVCKKMFGVMNEDGIPFLVNGVSEQPAESTSIHLYPNPTSTSFTLSGLEGVSSVRLVNSVGVEVKQWLMVNGQLSIDVSDLVNGLYFVNIRTATGATVKPIMVSH
jgi:ligand-binding sensor domain-containing protein